MFNLKPKRYKRRHAASWRRPLIAVIVLALALAGVTTVLAMKHELPFRKEQKTAVDTNTTANSGTKGEPAATDKQASSDNPPSSQSGTWSSDNKDPGTNEPSGPKPLVPECNFVSNHHPSLAANQPLASSCTTTVGATLQINFTKDGASKHLQTQKTDAGGGAYWTWSLQDLGLTVGSWHIQAVATLGSQSVTSDDSIALEVSP